jgi:hypothetical protein
MERKEKVMDTMAITTRLMQAFEEVINRLDVGFVKGSDLANVEFEVHCGGACVKHFVFRPIDKGEDNRKILNKWEMCVRNRKADLDLYKIIPFYCLIELTDATEKGETLVWKLIEIKHYVEDDGTEESEEIFLGYVKVHSEGFVAITTTNSAVYLAEELIRRDYWRLYIGW